MNKEGPTKVEYSSLKCTGCKYLKSKLFMSGPRPIHHHICQHPDNDKELGWQEMFMGEPGRFIGERDTTPSWCPFLQNKEG